jgi:hypothetical protein
VPFKLQLRGVIPLEHLRHFVSLEVRRQGQSLTVESFEVIGPLAQRGNRGGKRRRGPEDGAARRERRPVASQSAAAESEESQRPGPRSRAIIRPSR